MAEKHSKAPKKVLQYMKKVSSRMGGPKKPMTKAEITKGLGVAPKKARKRSKYAD